MKTSIQSLGFAWLAAAAVASAQPGSCTTDPFLQPDPSLWQLRNGDPAPSVPILWYDGATGILGIDTFGADRIAGTTTGFLIEGDDLGFIAISLRGPQLISPLLEGFVFNPSYGGLVWTVGPFPETTDLFGVGVNSEYLEVGCTPLFQFVPGLSASDFDSVAASFNVQKGVPGFEMFGHVQHVLSRDPGDFDADGSYTCRDIDALTAAIASGSFNVQLDLNFDNVLDTADRDAWLVLAGADPDSPTGGSPFLIGDANLDAAVDSMDFNVWQAHKFTSGTSWCTADFSADGVTDVQDFALWNENKFSQSGIAVPEPPTTTLIMGGFAGWLAMWRRMTRHKSPPQRSGGGRTR